jgi:hypothetical protein
MLRKESGIKWTIEAKQSFSYINQALTKSLVLISPNFSKDFLVFSFASKHNIEGVLLQRNEQNMEQPISFCRKALRDSELKYNVIEKHEYALVKTLK